MADYPFIPEGLFPVVAISPKITNGASTGDYISLKNAEMCWVVLQFQNATAATDATTIEMATDVAGTGTTAITNVVPIWYGVVSTASTQLTRQTDAVSYTTADVTGSKVMIFQIDPASLGSTYDCITVKVADSTHATNYVAAMYWIKPRYESKVASMTATEYIVD